MNKKGFTLVELLAVIVVLGIVATIGVASVNGISNAIKKDLLNKKYEGIEEAAILYGEDIRGSLMQSTSKHNGYPCINISISELVPKYLAPDDECPTESNCVLNPADKNQDLQHENVIIYYKNKRVRATVATEDKCKN